MYPGEMIQRMIGRSFNLNIKPRFTLKFKTITNLKYSTVSTVRNTFANDQDRSNSYQISDLRSEQLSRLQTLKPSEFSSLALNQLIADFLVSHTPNNLKMATKLIDKFFFKVPGIDPEGDLATLYILHLIGAKSISTCVNFLKSILSTKKDLNLKIPVTSFMLECTWRALINEKDDVAALELLQICYDSEIQVVNQFLNNDFKDKLILELFLPRLNWSAIDLIVRKSSSNGHQITTSAQVLQEIFHVLLHPNPDDLYFDPINSEPFTANIINARFHRLIEVLQRWKNSGIQIKGIQISKALEETFKRFLPTVSMMNELQKLV